MSLACMYCKYYEYDRGLSTVFWRVIQAQECLSIGRCNFANKTCGNAVLSTGRHSDGVQGCNDFEDIRDTLKYHVGDVFMDKKGTPIRIIKIKYEHRPALYRVEAFGNAEWSESEKSLDKYKQIYKAESEEQV